MGIKERRERERKTRREDILKAASEVFSEKGFSGATMESIGKRAELSPGTIYHYFESKDNLYASINLAGTSVLIRELEKIVRDRTLSPEEKINQYKNTMYKIFLSEPLIYAAIVHNLTGNMLPLLAKDLIRQITDSTRKLQHVAGKIFQEGIRKGKFEEGHEIMYADIVWSIFFGVKIWEEAKKKLNPKKDFTKTTLDAAFRIFLRGISKDGGKK
jgi:TetR/AcrR family transcriptional regulator